MKRRCCLLLMLIIVPDARAEQSLAESTIVLYNKNVPDSVQLAKFYADQRGIPRDHLVGLDCPQEEEISRDEYDRTIANPLREIFKTRNWWILRGSPGENATITATSIRFVAVIKGVPLKVRATTNYPGDVPGQPPIANRNEASVDSELAVLGLSSRQISGERSNPYFQNFRAIGDFDNAVLLLVCRLDGPSPDVVRRMITDAIATEKSGLWGRAYVDGAHNTTGDFAMGDEWLRSIADQLHNVGVPVIYDDKPETFPNGFPITDAALYYGWYNGNVSGPFARPDFHFLPGAIAVHIHSFSAATLRDANANWVAPLIAKGAAASIGNVYEPYLQLTPHLDIFNDRLLHGFTFAESAYMAVRVLSWMTVMVGDPLYRPFASWLQLESTTADTQWKRYHEFAVKNAARPPSEFRSLAWQTASAERNCPMLEDLAAIEAAQGDFSAATAHFPQARRCYRARDDLLRVTMEEVDAWRKQNSPKRALELVRTALRNAPDAPAAPLLRKMEAELAAAK
ncbi:MAG TPA: TIGR03790 family protein [Chthoniobacterales bacterium]|nr:TIGR03790 family protein [Chthoniobacterales bacterium]